MTRGTFAQPAVAENATGCPRQFGFELEFSGLTPDHCARVLAETLGGRRERLSAAEQKVVVPELGEFRIELDWSYLKRKAGEEASEWMEDLSRAAALVVPLEVVCPPLRLDRLDTLNVMEDALRRAGARGTGDSVLAAYGLHINAEIPRLEAECLAAYISSFCLLQWWLVTAHGVDLSRRATPYIDLYPEAYVRRLLDTRKASMDELLADYLSFNASRNRALDLLPLLSCIDEARVQQAVEDSRVKARPAFHYRLPDCRIEQPRWSMAQEWQRWCLVERLAFEDEARQQLAAAFIDADRPLVGVSRSHWVDYLDSWLHDRAWV